MWRAQLFAAVVSLGVLFASAGTTPAMTILPLDLPELTGQAERIFVGRVERVESGRDANGLPATWTTFTVAEKLKGPDAGHITLKQLGASLGPRVLPHPALPRYRPGESVVLFVHPESTLGFTSPVGLGQGCFRVHDDDGAAVVENDVGNRNLGPSLVRGAGPRAGTGSAASAASAPGSPPAAPLAMSELVARVRALVGGTP